LQQSNQINPLARVGQHEFRMYSALKNQDGLGAVHMTIWQRFRWWYAKRHARAVLTYHRRYFDF